MIERSHFQHIPYVIYLPDAFSQVGPLPLLTIFRASPDEWFQSRLDDSRGRRNIFYIVTDLIEKGWLEPCAFLFPSTCSQDQKEFYFADNVYAPEHLESNEPFLTQEFFENGLLPEIGNRYCLDVSRVSLDGFSLGGYTSLSYSFLSPGRYRSTGSFDGALLDYGFDNRKITPDTPSDLTFDTFPYLFGEDPDEDLFRSKNPADLLESGVEVENLFIMSSAELTPTSNRPRVENFLEILETKGIANQADGYLIDDNSTHQWYWVDEYLYRSLPFHARCLNQ